MAGIAWVTVRCLKMMRLRREGGCNLELHSDGPVPITQCKKYKDRYVVTKCCIGGPNNGRTAQQQILSQETQKVSGVVATSTGESSTLTEE